MKRILLLPLLMLAFALQMSAQKISILGDSYSTYKGYLEPDTNYVWYPFDGDNDVKRVEDTWWRILVKNTNMTLEKNNSFSGSTICYRGYNGEDYSLRSFENRCNNLGTPDIILIFGGTNDSWSGAKVGEYGGKDMYTYRPALDKMLKRMRKMYKKKKIYFILNTELRDDINESTLTLCKKHRIPVIVLHDIDKQSGHPSIKGMKAIAEQVKAAIQ